MVTSISRGRHHAFMKTSICSILQDPDQNALHHLPSLDRLGQPDIEAVQRLFCELEQSEAAREGLEAWVRGLQGSTLQHRCHGDMGQLQDGGGQVLVQCIKLRHFQQVAVQADHLNKSRSR